MAGCSKCNEYKERGHNHCRMCGADVRKGLARRPRKPAVFKPSEKYCGYCGEPREECGC